MNPTDADELGYGRGQTEDAPLLRERGLLITGFGLVGLTLVGLGLIELLGGLERLGTLVADAGPWAPVMFVLLKALTYLVAPLSGTPLKITAGVLFGFWPAIVYTVLGDVLGASVNYWIARGLGHSAIARFSGATALARIDALSDRLGGIRALVVARVILAPIYDFVSYAAGLAKIPFGTFASVTALAGVVPSLLMVGVGALYATDPLLLLVLVVAGGLLVCFLLVRHPEWYRKP